MAETAPVTKSNKMPAAIPYIVGNEAAERFNYYGLRAILTTFMIGQFFAAKYVGMENADQKAAAAANGATHDFVAMSYLLPLFGGMLADWFWGKYKTILYLSMVYVVGNIMLAVTVNNEMLFTSALMLIAMGAGGIKPCVSANVGDQFTEENSHLISKAFDAFYFSINAGSFLSILLIPYLNKYYGPQVAFGVPAIAMTIAIAFFYAGRDKYIRVPPKGDNNKKVIFVTAFITLLASYIYWDKYQHAGTGPVIGFWAVLVVIVAFIFKKQWFAKPGNFIGINLYAATNGGFENAAKEYGTETIEGVKSVWRVFAVFAFIPVFWALWDQNQSEWVVQATKMDLNFMGIKWEAEQISSVNAILILAFIPLFSFGIYPGLKKLGINVTPLRKFGAGLVVTALSFVIISLIQEKIDLYEPALKAYIDSMKALSDGEKANLVSQWMQAHSGQQIEWKGLIGNMTQDWIHEHHGVIIAWQLLAYVILTAGEIMVSITGLEYAYTQAPPSMKSTIMGCYLLMVTLGNVLVSMIQKNIENGGFFAAYKGASFFWLFTGICAATAVLFMFISPRMKEKSYIGGANIVD
jgi:proton-dependent oligopeptide transporter, POT family